MEAAPQGPKLPLVGNRFKDFREDDAPVSPVSSDRLAEGSLPEAVREVEVVPDIKVLPMSLGDDIQVSPTSEISGSLVFFSPAGGETIGALSRTMLSLTA